MAKLTFNPETQYLIELKFDAKIHRTAADKYRHLLSTAGLRIGIKAYEVDVWKIQITNTSGQIVFYKNRKNLTEPGTHVKLHPLFDSQWLRPSGAPQDVVIERFEYRAANRAYFATVRDCFGKLLSPKSTICISFTETEPIYATNQHQPVASSNQFND